MSDWWDENKHTVAAVGFLLGAAAVIGLGFYAKFRWEVNVRRTALIEAQELLQESPE